LFDEPALDDARRDSLRAYLNAMDIARLRQWAHLVSMRDSAVPADRQRMARLVEIATLSGRSLADWHRLSIPSPGVPTVTFVMTMDRAELYRRIDARVIEMVRQGFVGEVQGLLDAGYGSGIPGMNATGYLEMIPHVTEGRPLGETIALIQAASRQYARRQLTWLRTQVGPDAIALDAARPVPELADSVIDLWKQRQGLVGGTPRRENAP
jgi:tRNA dimethylallyltransferase